jgi:hypothetical protein
MQIINVCAKVIIINNEFPIVAVSKILQVRIQSKKLLKKKYRDYKYNERVFWNHEEAPQQYAKCLTYVWKPSVIEMKELIKKYRKFY